MGCCQHEEFEHDGAGNCTSPGCDCQGRDMPPEAATPTADGPSGEESYDDPEGEE